MTDSENPLPSSRCPIPSYTYIQSWTPPGKRVENSSLVESEYPHMKDFCHLEYTNNKLADHLNLKITHANSISKQHLRTPLVSRALIAKNFQVITENPNTKKETNQTHGRKKAQKRVSKSK